MLRSLLSGKKTFLTIFAILITWTVSAALQLPVSFEYGGRYYECPQAEECQQELVWTASDGNVQIRAEMKTYDYEDCIEWRMRILGSGTGASDIVANLRSFVFQRDTAGVIVRALRGTVNTAEDFAPVTVRLDSNSTNVFSQAATEGRSSAQWMPWIGVDFAEGDGVDFAVGWSGAWRADHGWSSEKGYSLATGLVKTHFRVLPGEELRLPSTLVFTRRKGMTVAAMQTRIHRFMVEYKSPRDAQGKLIRPILPITCGGGNKTPEMMFKVIDWAKRNKMPFDCFWVDAGWNGPPHMPDLLSNCGNMWFLYVGDWRFNTAVHPNGNLSAVADAAHAAGLRMLLWVEPERCVMEPPPPVFKEHRNWILPAQDRNVKNKRALNVNLGDPDARAWVLETVSKLVRESKLDIYRQDFNMNTLPLWQENDAPDRLGVTEMKYIDGLYRFWDELRRRFPHLMIENCASGGRRLDFEAVSRAHSYCRTDYAIGHCGAPQITDVQNISLNTLPYVPFQGSETTPALFFDDYGFFSSTCAGSVFTPSDWDAGIVKNAFTEEQTAWFKEVFAVADRMRPFYMGDYYPLTDPRVPSPPSWPEWSCAPERGWGYAVSREERRWCAWQLHRVDLNAGFAIAFRRPDAPECVLRANLGGLDPLATYDVETYHGARTCIKGAQLANWVVELRSPRSFRLVFYHKK